MRGTSNSSHTARHTRLASTPAASAWSAVRPFSSASTWSRATDSAYPGPKWSRIRTQNSDSRTTTPYGPFTGWPARTVDPTCSTGRVDSVDGPLGVLVELGFIACMVALLAFLIWQFRRRGKDD